MRFWWAALVGFGLALLLPRVAHAGPATKLVEKRLDAVFNVAAAKSSPGKRQRVRKALAALFDYDAMARAMETERWAKLSPGKRAQLRKEAREALIREHEVLVATKVKHGLQIRFVDEKQSKRGRVVIAEVAPKRRGAEDLVFVVRGTRVIDFELSGMSLQRAHRSQITRHMRRHPIDKTISKLRKNNRKPVEPMPTSSVNGFFPPKRPRKRSGMSEETFVAAVFATLTVAVIANHIISRIRPATPSVTHPLLPMGKLVPSR